MAATTSCRVRVESLPPLPHTKRWFQVLPTYARVTDLARAICADFAISVHVAVRLEIDGFELAPSAATAGVVRDGDLIMVSIGAEAEEGPSGMDIAQAAPRKRQRPVESDSENQPPTSKQLKTSRSAKGNPAHASSSRARNADYPAVNSSDDSQSFARRHFLPTDSSSDEGRLPNPAHSSSSRSRNVDDRAANSSDDSQPLARRNIVPTDSSSSDDDRLGHIRKSVPASVPQKRLHHDSLSSSDDSSTDFEARRTSPRIFGFADSDEEPVGPSSRSRVPPLQKSFSKRVTRDTSSHGSTYISSPKTFGFVDVDTDEEPVISSSRSRIPPVQKSSTNPKRPTNRREPSPPSPFVHHNRLSSPPTPFVSRNKLPTLRSLSSSSSSSSSDSFDDSSSSDFSEDSSSSDSSDDSSSSDSSNDSSSNDSSDDSSSSNSSSDFSSEINRSRSTPSDSSSSSKGLKSTVNSLPRINVPGLVSSSEDSSSKDDAKPAKASSRAPSKSSSKSAAAKPGKAPRPEPEPSAERKSRAVSKQQKQAKNDASQAKSQKSAPAPSGKSSVPLDASSSEEDSSSEDEADSAGPSGRPHTRSDLSAVPKSGKNPRSQPAPTTEPTHQAGSKQPRNAKNGATQAKASGTQIHAANQENVAPAASGAAKGSKAVTAGPATMTPPLSLGKNKRKQLQKLINVERTHVKFADGAESEEEEGELVENTGAGSSRSAPSSTRAIFSTVHLSDDFPTLQYYGAGNNMRDKGSAKQNGKEISSDGSGPPQQSSQSAEKSNTATVAAAPRKDYESMPLFTNRPVVGQVLVYKLLELSQSCTPEISDYKEATVIAYDNKRSLITLQPVLDSCDAHGNTDSDAMSRLLPASDDEWVVEGLPSDVVILDLGALMDARVVL
ncbi:hypothetical protein HDU90_000527 [Geranomyces variabilis]|nr:hypothetical protein HDU90_000527 [Geranomyces variabilis]